MVTHTLNFPLPDGMQAKSASEITNYFRNFDGECHILYKTTEANAKSIISLLSTEIAGGSEVTLRIDSEQSQADMDRFVNFLHALAIEAQDTTSA